MCSADVKITQSIKLHGLVRFMRVRLFKQPRTFEIAHEFKYFEAAFKTNMKLNESHYATNPFLFPLGLEGSPLHQNML